MDLGSVMLLKNTGLDSDGRLPRKHSIAKRCELLAERKAIPSIGDPARRETHLSRAIEFCP